MFMFVRECHTQRMPGRDKGFTVLMQRSNIMKGFMNARQDD